MTRDTLDNRRPSWTHVYDVGALEYRATCGYHVRAGVLELGEVFLNCGKADAHADVCAKEAAIAVSFAIQYGAPIDRLAAAMPRREDGTADGPLGALFDLLAKEGAPVVGDPEVD